MTQYLIEHFLVGQLQMRCSVVTDLESGDTIIIDGGEEFERISNWIDHFSGSGPDWQNQQKEKGIGHMSSFLHGRLLDLSTPMPILTIRDIYHFSWTITM